MLQWQDLWLVSGISFVQVKARHGAVFVLNDSPIYHFWILSSFSVFIQTSKTLFDIMKAKISLGFQVLFAWIWHLFNGVEAMFFKDNNETNSRR